MKSLKGFTPMQDAKEKRRTRIARALVLLILVISTVGVWVTVSYPAHAAGMKSSGIQQGNATTNAALGGTGATLPYAELKAHNSTTNGTIIGPSYTLGNVAFDAVDHQAVQLTKGQYVQFTLPQQANALNLRYSIPDSSSGGGINASI